MVAAEETVLILLAAGRSSRFEAGNKLEADLEGLPVGLHGAKTLADIPFKARVAVIDRLGLEFAGYRRVVNDSPEAGLARSLRLGVAAVQVDEAAAVMVALADMPRVTATHVRRLLRAAEGEDAVVASSDGVVSTPPAVFGRAHFRTLMALAGDAGARDLLRMAVQVVAPAGELADVDTLADLEALREGR